MFYRKLKANNLFTGINMLGTNSVLVTDEKGIIENVIPESEAGEGIEHFEGILSPGFINCHCHLELSYLKNKIPEQTGLADFVIQVINQRNFPEEEILQAISNAEQEMLNNGIVAVGDICNTTHTIPQKRKERLQYYNFVEVSGFVPQAAKQRFEQAVEISTQFAELNAPHSIVPHAPYSVSKELFALINEHSQGKIISIHNEESLEENKFFIEGKSKLDKVYDAIGVDISFFKPTGKSGLQTYLPWLNKAEKILFVHNTFISEDDVQQIICREMLEEKDDNKSIPLPFFVLCPNANLYIENKLPPIDILQKHHCPIAIGTDSLASNYSLDILSELRVLKTNFPFIPLDELLYWTTLNGARALKMDDKLGSFVKGKKPGVILIDTELKNVKRIV
ncbi:MAG: amidohydrolase family protein [Chitinophagaceae bacterium]|jgi:cytosine/adenosine deaminase-related metal-dependent hydrolase|nr:amidohydrolase family protein [Chitinophagaceae bacterium]